MRFIKALFLVAAAYVMSVTADRAADLCPAGPFETDPRVIAAAIAAQPLKPRVWDESRHSSPPLTDGFSWGSTGGLMHYGSDSLIYDAKRYVAVSATGTWPPRELVRRARSTSDFDGLPSNQIVHHSGRATFITTVARPTPDQATQFACLVNRLTATSKKEDSPTPDQPETHRMSPAENGAVREDEHCNSTGTYSIEGSDDLTGGRSQHDERGAVHPHTMSVGQCGRCYLCATHTVRTLVLAR